MLTPPLLHPSSPTHPVLLSAPQNKLSEEVQKQQDGPKAKGSPPTTQPELDAGPGTDPDSSSAEEDKDETGPLLERLKALEVTTLLCSNS